MKQNKYRNNILAKELQKHVAFIIMFKLRDYRLNKKITVSDVSVSKDLSFAKIFVFYYDYKKNTQSILEIKNMICLLNKTTGYIKKLLTKYMYLRKMPNFKFIYDNSVFLGNKINLLLIK